MPDLQANSRVGAFSESLTELPIIDPLVDQPNYFSILGCGGNGITLSTIAAELAFILDTARKRP
jgi:glycine/D-amino acid oxidase-like deaminating enzyme